MGRYLPALVLSLALSSCAADPSPYVAEVTTSPENPVPNRPFTIFADVTTRVEGVPATDVTVDGVARVNGPLVSLGSLEQGDPGTYVLRGLQVTEEAPVRLRFDIAGPLGSGSSSHRLDMTCSGDGSAGSPCCEATDCAGGLLCIYAACQEGLGEVDAPCFESNECASNRCEDGLCVPTVPILGLGTHSLDSLEATVIGSLADDLSDPRDVAINPDRPNEVWVANTRSQSIVIFTDPGTPGQWARTYWTPSSHHFFARVSAIAFGPANEMASSHETDIRTQGTMTPPDFMGPTLHYTDLSVFNAGLESHLDMLHNSPNGMGIAWEGGPPGTTNRADLRNFWIFDGYHSSLTRYAFNEDHGLGGEDHTDGVVRRYVEGQVSRVAGVVSHMEMDREAGMLYVADTGNNRVAVLDISTGTLGADIFPNYDGTDQKMVNGASLETVIDGAAYELQRPAGLALTDEYLFITDNGTSRILAFDRTTWELVDWLDTQLPPGALNGLAVSDDALYYTDVLSSNLHRVRVPAQ